MEESQVFTQSGTSEIRSFLIGSSFDETMLEKFMDFHRGCVKDGITEAFIYIDSPGGSVSTYLSIQAMVCSEEILYHTIALGSACSAACLLTAMGGFRWAIPETCFMFHDASSVTWGKQREMKETIEWNEMWLKRILEKFARETKKPLSFWMDLAYSKHSGDLYFTSEEALDWGVIDYIGLPEIQKHTPYTVNLPCTAAEFQKSIEGRANRRLLPTESEKEKKSTPKKKAKKTVKKRVVKKTVKKSSTTKGK